MGVRVVRHGARAEAVVRGGGGGADAVFGAVEREFETCERRAGEKGAEVR